MIDHVAVPVSDLEASRTFYDPILEQLGAGVVHEWPGGVLYGNADGMLALRQTDTVQPLHFAFKTDRAGVDAFHRRALELGASDNGAPGIREDFHENYYAAFVHDADGHNVEAVCQQPG
jgi:catechol 2,3-dioxygenase-like lactoylglutathione lyase family enzyme